jgi:sulfonate transport system ATP-binding protein
MSAHTRIGTSVSIQAATKAFGEKSVLRRLNLTLEPGTFTAVVGKSGSGKSTLLRLIAGLDHPSSGAVIVDGEPQTDHNPRTRVMFQDARLLPWKRVLHNVGLGLHGDWREDAQRVLLSVGLADRAGEYPSVLSGGEKQRVALARALIHKPQLLLLDEPLGALDALTRIEMQLLIERIWQAQQFTALLITHDVEEAVVLADRVVLIEDGQTTLDLAVDLPRPRQRGDAKLAALKAHILNRVMGVA